MRFVLLVPIIAYMVLFAFNLDLLSTTNSINIYGITTFHGPVFLYSIVFLILYLLIIYLIFDFGHALKNRKLDRLEKEIVELKSKLYDEREDELVVFMKEQRTRLDNFLTEQEAHLEKYKSENENNILRQKSEMDRILDKLNLVDKSILDKIKESFKGNKRPIE